MDRVSKDVISRQLVQGLSVSMLVSVSSLWLNDICKDKGKWEGLGVLE